MGACQRRYLIFFTCVSVPSPTPPDRSFYSKDRRRPWTSLLLSSLLLLSGSRLAHADSLTDVDEFIAQADSARLLKQFELELSALNIAGAERPADVRILW